MVFSDDYFEKAEEMWKKTDSRTGKEIIDPNDIIPGVTIRQGPTKACSYSSGSFADR